jgi:hypothetical protein
MYKQYKCILHIVHNNNERIPLDDALKYLEKKKLKKNQIIDMITLHRISFSISNSYIE